MKTHEHFCRLCHLLLNDLKGCPEVDNPPLGEDTAVFVDCLELPTLYDDDKIKEDADSRSRPGYAGFDASVMVMLHRHTALREAKAEKVPERLAYRFNVKLDDRKDPSFTDTRRFCIQRSETVLGNPKSSFPVSEAE
jgi:hypothetical protein